MITHSNCSNTQSAIIPILQIIMIQTESSHIKFVVELYDKCHETLRQYIKFLEVGAWLYTCAVVPCVVGLLIWT